MLLIMALGLMVISAYIEFKVIQKVAFIRWLNHKSWAIGFIMSMALSLALGWAFGLSGLVAGMAGLGSTVITDPVHAVNRRKSSDSEFARKYNEIKDTYRPVLKLVKLPFIIAAFLIMLPVKVRRLTDSQVS